MDRSRETTEFREDDEAYKVLTVVHIKYVGIFCGLFGFFVIVCSFGIGTAYFPWSLYDTTFDIIALFGFLIYVVSGLVVHFCLLVSIHKTDCSYAIPFILYHCFLVALEAITSLIAMGELVADQTVRIEDGDQAARYTLFATPGLIAFETMMVYVVFRLRSYLRNKRRHIRHGLPPPLREVASADHIFRMASTASVSPSESIVSSQTPAIPNDNEKQSPA